MRASEAKASYVRVSEERASKCERGLATVSRARASRGNQGEVK